MCQLCVAHLVSIILVNLRQEEREKDRERGGGESPLSISIHGTSTVNDFLFRAGREEERESSLRERM